MSDPNLESTQPNSSLDSTQPSQPLETPSAEETQTIESPGTPQQASPPPRRFRFPWRNLLLGFLGLLLLIGLGAFGGYQAAIADRQAAYQARLSKELTEQYAMALLDMASGQYGLAQQRLEYIIQNNPSFPGAAEKLAEVMILSLQTATPTITPTVTPTATPDLRDVEEIFQRARQAIEAADWPGALANLDTLRRKDPNYRTAEVDGMYYFALRNYGYDLITKQGNLEGGIYHLTLAERFGPLDSVANGLREGARLYVLAASFWELDWKNAVYYFSQLYAAWPNMWDGTMTASERYRVASIRYGDELLAKEQWCAAYEQYSNASLIAPLDKVAQKNYEIAMYNCMPPTPFVPTAPATPTP